MLSGSKIIDPDLVLRCVSQGTTFKQIRGVRLLSMIRTENKNYDKIIDQSPNSKNIDTIETIDTLVRDNHRKYTARIEKYQSKGYDIPWIRKKMAQLLVDLPDDATILDVGCGKGHMALAIARSGKNCITVDTSADEINDARLNAIFYKVADRIDFQLQDAGQLKFSPRSFNAVVSAALFHHLADPSSVLVEMLRVCKLCGKIVISDLNEHGQQAVAKVHHEEGREHMLAGWSIEQIKAWFEKQGFHPRTFKEVGETIIAVEILVD